MVEWAYRLVDSEDNPSKNSENDWDGLWLIANISVPNFYLENAGGLKADLFRKVYMLDMWDNRGFAVNFQHSDLLSSSV